MRLSMKNNIAFTITFLAFSYSTGSIGHDLNGLLVTRTLPESTRAEIEARDKIRTQSPKEILDPNLPRDRRAELTKSLGLPAKFESPEAVVSARALWPQNSTLSMCFFDGNPSVQQAVLEIAQEIYNETNLKLDPKRYSCADKDAEIRISFRQVGYWSYVGTDALLIEKGRPTLGLQNLDVRDSLNEQQKGIVRHEIMHSIGALHEHQHPAADCEKQLDWDKVATLLGWTPQEMRTNFSQLIFNSNTITSSYDQKSIMHYQLPPSYWKAGTRSSCYIRFNNVQLSTTDKEMLNNVYPK